MYHPAGRQAGVDVHAETRVFAPVDPDPLQADDPLVGRAEQEPAAAGGGVRQTRSSRRPTRGGQARAPRRSPPPWSRSRRAGPRSAPGRAGGIVPAVSRRTAMPSARPLPPLGPAGDLAASPAKPPATAATAAATATRWQPPPRPEAAASARGRPALRTPRPVPAAPGRELLAGKPMRTDGESADPLIAARTVSSTAGTDVGERDLVPQSDQQFKLVHRWPPWTGERAGRTCSGAGRRPGPRPGSPGQDRPVAGAAARGPG